MFVRPRQLAFVLTPGVVLLLEVFPEYQSAVIRAKVLHAPAGLIDDLLEWIVLTLVGGGWLGNSLARRDVRLWPGSHIVGVVSKS